MTTFFAIVIAALILAAANIYVNTTRDTEARDTGRHLREYIEDIHLLYERQTTEAMRLNLTLEAIERILAELRDISLQSHIVEDWDKDKWNEIAAQYGK